MVKFALFVGISAGDLLLEGVAAGKDDRIHGLANEVKVVLEALLILGQLRNLLLNQADH